MTDNEVNAQQDSTEQKPQQAPQEDQSRHLFAALLILAALIFWGIQHPETAKRIALVLLGFGGIVMIHELGHFIVAKLGGIKVEAFSIGMPPVVLGIRKLKKGWRVRFFPKPDSTESVEAGDNETEYQLGLFPIGGFVKMLGQSDTGAAGADEDPRSYANRPIWIRICVVSAGVIFNAIGAAVLFMILFLNGIKLPPAVVGNVMNNSPAYDAGIRPGDEIVEVNGDRFVNFEAVQLSAALSSPGEPISYIVLHSDETEEKIEVVAETRGGDTSKMRYSGIAQATTLTLNPRIADDPNQVMELFEKTALRPGDEIKAVNGQPVQSPWQYEKLLSQTFSPEVQLQVSRQWPPSPENDQRTIETIKLPMHVSYVVDNFRNEYDLAHFGSMVPRLKIAGVSEPTKINRLVNWFRVTILRKESLPTLDKLLLPGDILLKVNDVEYPNYQQTREITTAHKDQDLLVTVLRMDKQGNEQEVEVVVHPKATPGSKRVTIGLALSLDVEHPVIAQVVSDPAVKGDVRDIPSGATIVTVAGQPVKDFYDIATLLQNNAGKQVVVEYLSEIKNGSVSLTVPEHDPIHAQATLSYILPFSEYTREFKASNPVQAVQMGFKKLSQFISQNYVTIARLIKRDLDTSSLMGPVGILSVSYQATGASLDRYLYFLGLISSCLAVMNLLPLPVLDGGHIVMLIIEKITGKPIHEKVLAPIMYVGLALLLGLILWVSYNDFIRILFG